MNKILILIVLKVINIFVITITSYYFLIFLNLSDKLQFITIYTV